MPYPGLCLTSNIWSEFLPSFTVTVLPLLLKWKEQSFLWDIFYQTRVRLTAALSDWKCHYRTKWRTPCARNFSMVQSSIVSIFTSEEALLKIRMGSKIWTSKIRPPRIHILFYLPIYHSPFSRTGHLKNFNFLRTFCEKLSGIVTPSFPNSVSPWWPNADEEASSPWTSTIFEQYFLPKLYEKRSWTSTGKFCCRASTEYQMAVLDKPL